ncbi:MAG TPA: DUF5916 domain-containing protein [Lentimicrobium sp.]|nr:DUF5916 domain-containing protein [Lentimicrobium sp.]
MRFLYTLLVIVLTGNCLFAQNEHALPVLEAVRITKAPVIDAIIDDEAWKTDNIATNLRQRDPVFDTKARFNTEIRIVYDDKAIYVAAVMYDSSPDSIKKELATRDNDGKNADYFYLAFDTWNSRQDAYIFGVSASGIQVDKRIMDETYDAVWGSAVRINETGWVAEMRIPYSALRFPALKEQQWGLQIVRTVRRNRENDQWALEPKDTDNTIKYWGTLTGLNDIDPPLRLSALPYLSAGLQYDSHESSKGFSNTYNGGMDLKWGLNESFTLDMILMPDFSQVQTDAVEKNLSPFEITYDENRPFFNEGTDLFQKGDLFYSRRIGHVPLKYYSVSSIMDAGEHIVSNPYSSKLLNAVKLSGRTSEGLGIGVLNAFTGNTYAVVSDSAGNKRDILTDPFTNYNILVLDQTLPNNSSVYLINTNVSRPDGWKKSDVLGGGFKLSEKSNTYLLQFDLSSTNTVTPVVNDTIEDKVKKSGIFYNVAFEKTKGKFRFSIYQLGMNDKYDRNDLGVNHTNDWLDRGITIGYNVYEPFSIFRNFYQSINVFKEIKQSSGKNINTILTYRFNTTFTNYLSFWGNVAYSPYDRYDYYEPRSTGRVWVSPGYLAAYIGYSSDYRKVLAFDGELDWHRDFDKNVWKTISIEPIIRVSDKFKLNPEFLYQTGIHDKGCVSEFEARDVYFGDRDIKLIINSISGEYLFSNKISLSLWLRHYWQRIEYNDYYLLTPIGELTPSDGFSTNNLNVNYFNIDLVFGWEFSPGSMFNVVWKNAIVQENQDYRIKYFKNFEKTISSPQINNLSVKILYYLDYQMLKKKN